MPTAHTPGVQSPANGNVDNGAPIVTGVRFTVDTTQPITGIALWVPATNTGTYTAGLYQSTSDDDPTGSGAGTELRTASLAAAGLTAGGWDFIPITSYTPSTGVVYTAAVHSSSGRYVASSGGLASAISGGGVTLLADGSDPNPPGLGTLRNGVFDESGSLIYPNETFGQADYFIDVIRGNPPVVLGQAVETNLANALGRSKRLTLGQALETDTAGTVGPAGAVPVPATLSASSAAVRLTSSSAGGSA